MSDDYERGRRDGLRLALAVLAAEESKWAALLGRSPAWRTNATREVRHKSLQVAQKTPWTPSLPQLSIRPACSFISQ